MSLTKPFQRGRKVSIAVQLDPDQCEGLDQISAKRRTSRSAIVREAVDLYLAENSNDTSIQEPREARDAA